MIARSKDDSPEPITHMVYASSVDYMDDDDLLFSRPMRPIIDRADCRHYRRKDAQMEREAEIES